MFKAKSSGAPVITSRSDRDLVAIAPTGSGKTPGGLGLVGPGGLLGGKQVEHGSRISRNRLFLIACLDATGPSIQS